MIESRIKRALWAVSILIALGFGGHFAYVFFRWWDFEETQQSLEIAVGIPIALWTLFFILRWIWIGNIRSAQSLETQADKSTSALLATQEFQATPVVPPAMMESPSVIPVPKLATFWPRLWARCIDLPLVFLIVSIVREIAPSFKNLIPGGAGIFADLFFWMAFFCVAVLVYDTFLLAKFGTTLGKKLFGLQVRSVDLRLPTTDEAFRRARKHLSSGLYFTLYFPFLQLLSVFILWKNREASTPWDLMSRTFVQQRPISYFRYVIAALIAIILITSTVVAQKVAKERTKEEFRSSIFQ